MDVEIIPIQKVNETSKDYSKHQTLNGPNAKPIGYHSNRLVITTGINTGGVAALMLDNLSYFTSYFTLNVK